MPKAVRILVEIPESWRQPDGVDSGLVGALDQPVPSRVARGIVIARDIESAQGGRKQDGGEVRCGERRHIGHSGRTRLSDSMVSMPSPAAMTRARAPEPDAMPEQIAHRLSRRRDWRFSEPSERARCDERQ